MFQAIKAVGRSDSVLKVDFPIRIFALAVLIISVRYGVIYFALSEILTTIFGTILYAKAAKKIIGYSGRELCSDFIVNIILAGIMGIIVWEIGKILKISNLFLIVIQCCAGGVIYVFLSIITKSESFYYVINMGKEILKIKGEKIG